MGPRSQQVHSSPSWVAPACHHGPPSDCVSCVEHRVLCFFHAGGHGSFTAAPPGQHLHAIMGPILIVLIVLSIKFYISFMQAVTAASQQPFLQHLHAIMGPALAAAVAAAFVGAPPLWFCILCPTVLGLAAPLIVNLALNQVQASRMVPLSVET
eukprot:1159732-Pelagomonas_calceolata.AAC.2